MSIVDTEQQFTSARHRDNTPKPLPFQVFRRTGLYLTFAVLAGVSALALAAAAVLRDAPLLWVPAVVVLALGLIAIPGLGDSQTPVFVADQFGVRMHIREIWVGLLWREIGELIVEPSSTGRDGRIRVTTKDARHSYLTPVGFTTSVTVREAEAELARLRAAAS